ncbi:MAG: hypothetical protein GX247_04145 [Mollicutes bacterium]|nr:hypothetical protein [Mollicutes bacterium]
MEYKIKRKKVDGEMVYGIVDENLKEVLPFKYSHIEERTTDYDNDAKIKYYVISNQDNKKGVFFYGSVVLEPIYDPYHPRFIVGR